LWLIVQCVVAISFGWWLIRLGERDLRAAEIAGLLVALAFTVAFNNWVRYRRAGRP
jgi:hypothetical protein